MGSHEIHGDHDDTVLSLMDSGLYNWDQQLIDSNGQLLTDGSDNREPSHCCLNCLVMSAPLARAGAAVPPVRLAETAESGQAGMSVCAAGVWHSEPEASKAFLRTADDCVSGIGKAMASVGAGDNTARLALLPAPGATTASLPQVVKAASLYVRGLPPGALNASTTCGVSERWSTGSGVARPAVCALLFVTRGCTHAWE
jgi:hypothetical protein